MSHAIDAHASPLAIHQTALIHSPPLRSHRPGRLSVYDLLWAALAIGAAVKVTAAD
ncbi:MAG: hypothetical protein H6704_14660 [Myxococcales bacterium]|nr:hypothetical protein [Myxococcales bacterium]